MRPLLPLDIRMRLPAALSAILRTAARDLRSVLLVLPLSGGPAVAAGPEVPLELPGSFSGTLPCADCPGVDWHLDLWPDGRFALSRRYREREARDDALGRWRLGAEGDTLLLHDGRETPLHLAIVDRRRLRLLDRRGGVIESSLPYALVSDGELMPAELQLNLGGEFRYFADAAMLEECLGGARFPVLMEGDYAALERAYLQADKPEPGAPLYVRVDASIVNRQAMEGEGPPRSLRVDRFVAAQPGMRCERAMSTASLANTYWRLLRIGEETVDTPQAQRESHVIFREAEGRVAGLGGCNRFSASYRVDGTVLSLGPLMATRMACPPPLDTLEQSLFAAFDATAGWRISGQLLELLDGGGSTLAVFEAVYLP